MSSAKADSPSQARSFLTLMLFSGLNIGSGIGVQIANLYYFGTGPDKDAYDIAFFIPTLLIYLFGLDLWKGISTALFSRLAVNETEEGQKLFSSILTLLITAGTSLSVLTFVLAPWIVPLVAGGFDAERTALAVKLLRMMIPVIVLLNLTGFFDSVLIAHHVYGWGSLSLVLLKVAQVTAVIGFASRFGIEVLPIGTVIGLAIALTLQVVMLRRQGLHYDWFYLNLRSPKLREALWQTIPVFLSVVAVQLSMVVVQNVASRGEVGTIAALNYAIRLMAITGQFLITPIATSFAPRIARSVEARDTVSAAALTNRNATWMTYATWTSALLVILAAEPILAFLFQYSGELADKDVVRIAFFMKVIALLSWVRGIALLGIHLSLAQSAAWHVFQINLAVALGSTITVLLLCVTAGIEVAVPTAYLAGGVCSAVVGVYWLHVAFGNVANVLVGRIAAWAGVTLIGGVAALLVNRLVVVLAPELPDIVYALVRVVVALLVVIPVATILRLPEMDVGLQAIRQAIGARLARIRARA